MAVSILNKAVDVFGLVLRCIKALNTPEKSETPITARKVKEAELSAKAGARESRTIEKAVVNCRLKQQFVVDKVDAKGHKAPEEGQKHTVTATGSRLPTCRRLCTCRQPGVVRYIFNATYLG